MATTSQNVLDLDTATFDAAIAGAPGRVLVDFWAEWCPPCRMLGPTIDEVADGRAGTTATVAKVDIDGSPELAARYSVASIPTVLVFEHGEVVDRLVGIQSRDRYEDALGT